MRLMGMDNVLNKLNAEIPTMPPKHFASTVIVLLSATGPVFAQGIAGWTGEGSINVGVTTGNTETTDIGVGLKGARQFGDWRAKAQATAETTASRAATVGGWPDSWIAT
jgi:hypothetical protein